MIVLRIEISTNQLINQVSFWYEKKFKDKYSRHDSREMEYFGSQVSHVRHDEDENRLDNYKIEIAHSQKH